MINECIPVYLKKAKEIAEQHSAARAELDKAVLDRALGKDTWQELKELLLTKRAPGDGVSLVPMESSPQEDASQEKADQALNELDNKRAKSRPLRREEVASLEPIKELANRKLASTIDSLPRTDHLPASCDDPNLSSKVEVLLADFCKEEDIQLREEEFKHLWLHLCVEAMRRKRQAKERKARRK
jgi:hypothetical protein